MKLIDAATPPDQEDAPGLPAQVAALTGRGTADKLGSGRQVGGIRRPDMSLRQIPLPQPSTPSTSPSLLDFSHFSNRHSRSRVDGLKKVRSALFIAFWTAVTVWKRPCSGRKRSKAS